MNNKTPAITMISKVIAHAEIRHSFNFRFIFFTNSISYKCTAADWKTIPGYIKRFLELLTNVLKKQYLVINEAKK